MTNTVIGSTPKLLAGQRRLWQNLATLALLVIVALAVGFVLRDVFPYYLNHDEATFGRRFWNNQLFFLAHITGGVVALLTGLWQMWSGHRREPMRVHRWIGRVFIAGVAVGATGAFDLAIVIMMTRPDWPFGVGLFAMATAWVATTGMALYAILKREIEAHQEWMIRAYVVTFSFVTFRIFHDFGPTAQLQPRAGLNVTLAWASWVVPLLITELLVQLRRMHKGSMRSF